MDSKDPDKGNEEPDKGKDPDLSLDRLIKANKNNIARKLLAGEILSRKDLDTLSAIEQFEAKRKSGESSEEDGVPERLKIKRPYTLSDAALKQRRKAARGSKVNHWKHGRTAKSFLNRVRPCHKTCPQYPCEIVADGGTQPGGVCLDKAAVIYGYQAVVRAINEKDYKDFHEIAAFTIAESLHTVNMLREDIVRDGTMLKREKYNTNGGVMGYEIVPHPSLLALPKMIADLGITPSEFLITPRSVSRSGSEEKGAKTLADIMSSIGRKNRDEE
jgi:hypothetical protein